MGAARFDKLLPVDIADTADLVRIHRGDRGPVFFGPAPTEPPGNRFDAPRREYRMLYCAQHLEGAFVETILRKRDRPLTPAFVNSRSMTLLRPRRKLLLAKVYDEGLQVHGIDLGAITIEDYAPSRALALDFFNQFADLDGLAYRSRFNNGEICYALFDRVRADELAPGITTAFGDIPDRVREVMGLHGAVFDKSPPFPPI